MSGWLHKLFAADSPVTLWMFWKFSHRLLWKICKSGGRFHSVASLLWQVHKVEWAGHVLPVCQPITVNRCLKENCSYFVQHWMLKVHVSGKEGHGWKIFPKTIFFNLQNFFLNATLLGAVIFCDLVLIWTSWCSLRRMLYLVWILLLKHWNLGGCFSDLLKSTWRLVESCGVPFPDFAEVQLIHKCQLLTSVF